MNPDYMKLAALDKELRPFGLVATLDFIRTNRLDRYSREQIATACAVNDEAEPRPKRRS